MSVLQDGYTLHSPASRVGTVTLGDLGHASADQLARLWDAFVAAARRGGARVVERRQQEALRYIRRVKVQCGYAAGSTQG
jgi:hypothetical protein